MSKATDITEMHHELMKAEQLLPFTEAAVKKAFTDRLAILGLEGVRVEEVDADLEGLVTVSFVDEDEGEVLDISFMVEDGIAEAIILDDEGTEEGEAVVIDLSTLNPALYNVGEVSQYVNLTELSWLNKSAMLALLEGGLYGENDELNKLPDPYDANGNKQVVYERTATVVRGGKKVRLAVVRRKRKKILTSKQKAGFRKAALKRRTQKNAIARKRKKSLKLRKTSGIKTAKRGARKRMKVSGT